MPSLTVDLSADALTSLDVQARRHQRSLEEEARALLEENLVRRRFWLWQSARRKPAAGAPSGHLRGRSAAPAEELAVPESYQRDLRRAAEILRQVGCSEIYVFGSLLGGETDDRSDIDLAVRGCPEKMFFKILGKLMRELDHPVDLVDLDEDNPFVRLLLKEGQLARIA